MQFSDCGRALRPGEIENIQKRLGFVFPRDVVNCYLNANGGVPERNTYENDDIRLEIRELLPLLDAAEEGETAMQVYEDLVLREGLLPNRMFPFAGDTNGNYLYFDSETASGSVYLSLHDSIYPEDKLIDLGASFAEFWRRLK
jgi:hypothetical protein